jgi:hypothetical protein
LTSDAKLVSDIVRGVALLTFLLGLMGLVTGAAISYQQPPSPLAPFTVAGASISTLIGTILVILIKVGIIGE